jgi:hypothetical protein
MRSPSLGHRSQGALAAIAGRQPNANAAAATANSNGGNIVWAAVRLLAAHPIASYLREAHGTATAPGVRSTVGALYVRAFAAAAFAVVYAV